jgi:hypothetical protein
MPCLACQNVLRIIWGSEEPRIAQPDSCAQWVGGPAMSPNLASCVDHQQTTVGKNVFVILASEKSSAGEFLSRADCVVYIAGTVRIVLTCR